jgi:hypothetical protein
MRLNLLLRVVLVHAIIAFAGPSWVAADALRLDGSVWLARFQQQAKTKVGAPRGERLVENNNLVLSLTATYDLARFVAVGAFLEFDAGTRRAGELQGFDSEGRATIEPTIGGNFAEVWSGVLVRPRFEPSLVRSILGPSGAVYLLTSAMRH